MNANNRVAMLPGSNFAESALVHRIHERSNDYVGVSLILLTDNFPKRNSLFQIWTPVRCCETRPLLCDSRTALPANRRFLRSADSHDILRRFVARFAYTCVLLTLFGLVVCFLGKMAHLATSDNHSLTISMSLAAGFKVGRAITEGRAHRLLLSSRHPEKHFCRATTYTLFVRKSIQLNLILEFRSPNSNKDSRYRARIHVCRKCCELSREF